VPLLVEEWNLPAHAFILSEAGRVTQVVEVGAVEDEVEEEGATLKDFVIAEVDDVPRAVEEWVTELDCMVDTGVGDCTTVELDVRTETKDFVGVVVVVVVEDFTTGVDDVPEDVVQLVLDAPNAVEESPPTVRVV
jgi:hypothetical protein